MNARNGDVELVIPMISEMELAASKTAEAVADLMGFARDSVDEIKLALVEACINAFEHSRSPDQRLRIHFAIAPEALTVSIADRGRGFTVGHVREELAARRRAGKRTRGWGLRVMEELMDEVRVDSSDGGTTITMVKRLAAPPVAPPSVNVATHVLQSAASGS